jgi:hypothetical protein
MFFGLLIVIVICAAAIGIYALNIVDRQIISVTHDLKSGLAAWREILPFADALNDRRAADYRGSIDVSARLLAPNGSRRESIVVVDVANRGDETVSFLTLRVVLEDERQVPARELTIVAATPLAIEDEWVGPLMPASQTEGRAYEGTRRFWQYVAGAEADWTPRVEITDLRINVPLPARGSPESETSARTNVPRLPGSPPSDRTQGAATSTGAEDDDSDR